MARWCTHIHGGNGGTYRKAGEDADAMLRRRRRRVSGLFLSEARGTELAAMVRARGGEEARVRRRKKASSTPLFIGGGVVAGAVTMPPGSQMALQP